MKKLNRKILISTGGTGGHVFPAYSLAQYLANQDYSIEIVTDTRGMKFLKNSTINLKLINTGTIFQKKVRFGHIIRIQNCCLTPSDSESESKIVVF